MTTNNTRPRAKAARVSRIEFLVADQQGDDLDCHGGHRFQWIGGQIGGQTGGHDDDHGFADGRETANKNAATMPGKAAGKTTRVMVSERVAPAHKNRRAGLAARR